MGCCYSSNASPPPQQLALNPKPHLLEEEAVKEVVLSEAPFPPPPPAPTPLPPPPPLRQLPEAHLTGQLIKKQHSAPEKEEEEELSTMRTPDVSASVASHQASETCSVTETVDSTATTGSTSRGRGGDDEAVSKKMVINKGNNKLVRSSSGRGQVNRRRHNADSKISVGGGGERESRGGRGPRDVAAAGQSGRRAAGSRRDGVGERSGRRSRSPATGRAGGGLARGAGSTPGDKVAGRGGGVRLVGAGAGAGGGGSVKKEEVESDGGLTPPVGAEEGRSNGEGGGGGELVDNPLVSLECFIFL